MTTATGFEHAAHALRMRGSVSLPGTSDGQAGALKALYSVLIGLLLLLVVGGLVFAVIAAASGVRFTGATVFGILMVEAVLVGLAARMIANRRRQRRFLEAERLPVVIDARGLGLRGVGPIPWQDFLPARHEWVRAKSSGSYQRRALMPLSESGLVGVNERLPAELRHRVGPSGTIRDRRCRWIQLPGVEGMHEREVMALVNLAHAMFLGYPGGAPGGGLPAR